MIDGSVVGTLVRLVLSLATVLALMVFLARFLRNRQLGIGIGIGAGAGATQRRRKALLLEVVTRQGLSRGSSLAVVRVSGQLLLLGVTESNVSVLRELEELDEAELVPEAQDNLAMVHSPLAMGNSPLGIRGATLGSAVEMMRQRTVRRG
jgi:flagellar protein FliO/FliZ